MSAVLYGDLVKADRWEESKHPRDDDGQFTEKGGGRQRSGVRAEERAKQAGRRLAAVQRDFANEQLGHKRLPKTPPIKAKTELGREIEIDPQAYNETRSYYRGAAESLFGETVGFGVGEAAFSVASKALTRLPAPLPFMGGAVADIALGEAARRFAGRGGRIVDQELLGNESSAIAEQKRRNLTALGRQIPLEPMGEFESSGEMIGGMLGSWGGRALSAPAWFSGPVTGLLATAAMGSTGGMLGAEVGGEAGRLLDAYFAKACGRLTSGEAIDFQQAAALAVAQYRLEKAYDRHVETCAALEKVYDQHRAAALAKADGDIVRVPAHTRRVDGKEVQVEAYQYQRAGGSAPKRIGYQPKLRLEDHGARFRDPRIAKLIRRGKGFLRSEATKRWARRSFDIVSTGIDMVEAASGTYDPVRARDMGQLIEMAVDYLDALGVDAGKELAKERLGGWKRMIDRLKRVAKVDKTGDLAKAGNQEAALETLDLLWAISRYVAALPEDEQGRVALSVLRYMSDAGDAEDEAIFLNVMEGLAEAEIVEPGDA